MTEEDGWYTKDAEKNRAGGEKERDGRKEEKTILSDGDVDDQKMHVSESE